MTTPIGLNEYVRVAMPAPEPDLYGHVAACVPRFGVYQVWFGDRDYQWVAEGRLFRPDPPTDNTQRVELGDNAQNRNLLKS